MAVLPSISAVRESASTHNHLPVRGEEQEGHQVPPNTARKQRLRSGAYVPAQNRKLKEVIIYIHLYFSEISSHCGQLEGEELYLTSAAHMLSNVPVNSTLLLQTMEILQNFS